MAEQELDVVALGRRIRRLRHQHDPELEQQDLADRAGISRATVGRLERGAIAHPTITALRAIAQALDVSMDALLEDRPRSGIPDEEMSPDLAAFIRNVKDMTPAERSWLQRAYDLLRERMPPGTPFI